MVALMEMISVQEYLEAVMLNLRRFSHGVSARATPIASLAQRDGLKYIGATVWKTWGLSAAAQAKVSGAPLASKATYVALAVRSR